jgi:hypothetical protein
VSKRVNAAVDGVEATGCESVTDRAWADAQRQELTSRDNAMLHAGQFRDFTLT